jgi:hypothetical protein
LVALSEGFIFFAGRAEEGFEFGGEEGADLGGAVVPGVGDVFAVVTEVAEVEAIGAVGPNVDDLAHLGKEGGLAVGGEAHDFVLVAEMGEAEVLGEGGVEDAEGMGEIDAGIDADGGRVG